MAYYGISIDTTFIDFPRLPQSMASIDPHDSSSSPCPSSPSIHPSTIQWSGFFRLQLMYIGIYSSSLLYLSIQFRNTPETRYKHIVVEGLKMHFSSPSTSTFYCFWQSNCINCTCRVLLLLPYHWTYCSSSVHVTIQGYRMQIINIMIQCTEAEEDALEIDQTTSLVSLSWVRGCHTNSSAASVCPPPPPLHPIQSSPVHVDVHRMVGSTHNRITGHKYGLS